MRYWTSEMARADALLFGRVTYEMMESAWRRPASGIWPDWMAERDIPFAEGAGGWDVRDDAHFCAFADEVTAYVLSRKESQFVNIRQTAERLSGCRHTGDARQRQWLEIPRLVCLLQLEEAISSIASTPSERYLPEVIVDLAAHESAGAAAVTELMALIPTGSAFILVDEGFLNLAPGLADRSFPPAETVPLRGSRIPAATERVVLFPEPFGPRRPTISPRRTSKEMPSSASVPP